MDCTFTAVPHSPGISFNWRYRIALSFIQLPNTAPIAPHNCSMGSSGKSRPVFSLMAALNSSTSSFISSVVSSVSSSTPRSFFFFSMITSKGSSSSLFTGLRSSTTSPYICTNLLNESHAKRGLPEILARPSVISSLIPRLRTVSIIPGMETRAPERTENNNGLDGSPNFLPCSASTLASAAFTSSSNPSGYCLLLS